MPRLSLGKPMELDLQTVDAILAGQSPYLKTHARSELPSLDLHEFSCCSDSVLERLVSNIGPLDYFWLGVECLPLEHALKLKRLRTFHIGFPNLICLHEAPARLMAADDWPLGNAPILEFGVRTPLSDEVAGALVQNPCDGMMLSLDLPSISLDVVRLLMPRPAYLYLHVDNEQLTADLAKAFSRHRGYFLTVFIDLGLVDETFRGMAIRKALGSNSRKRWSINRRRSRLVVYDFDEDWVEDDFEPTETN